MHQKRKIIFGDYDTVRDGPWTLCALELSEPEIQAEVVQVPGRIKGPLDLSTALTGGEPVFNGRTLTARLECSEGTRLDRLHMIATMQRRLHGRSVKIILPDDPARYIVGCVTVHPDYCDPAHASVTVTATCEPWRYNVTQTRIRLRASSTEQLTVLPNAGGLLLSPDIFVEDGAALKLSTGDLAWTLSGGVYALYELELKPGANTPLHYSGTGSATIIYREAVL